jgi:acetyl-CoA acetyltransferase
MGDVFPRGRVSISGASTFGVGEMPGHSTIEMAGKAVQLALADAEIALPEVDGLFIALPDDLFAGLSLAQYLGLHPRFTDNNRAGGASFMSHLVTACMMLDAGYLDCAVIAYGANQRSSGGKLSTPARPDRWDAPSGPMYPLSFYALAAARHMHQYGTTREDLAHVAVAARLWANTNPEAFAKGPLTIEDVATSRLISSPIRARDCCLVTDGAAAMVLTRTDRAKDGPKPLVPILGAAAATWYNSVTQADDITITAAAESGPRAMAMAGLTPGQIDTVQLYDAFTINTILFLEDLGFCAKGEGGKFVAGGAIAPGGSLPVNTNGGGLSCCHPGMYGMFAMVEAVRQMRGEAANQIAGAKTALAHGNGGTLSAQATVIFGNAETV